MDMYNQTTWQGIPKKSLNTKQTITTIPTQQYKRLPNKKQRKVIGHVLDLIKEELQSSQEYSLEIMGGPMWEKQLNLRGILSSNKWVDAWGLEVRHKGLKLTSMKFWNSIPKAFFQDHMKRNILEQKQN